MTMNEQMTENGEHPIISSTGRSGFISAVITIFLGIGVGHMYAGFLKRGVFLLVINTFFIFASSIIMNFFPILSLMILVLWILFKIYVIFDSFYISKMGMIRKYNRWYYYIFAALVVFAVVKPNSIIVKKYICKSYMIPTSSMEPTINPRDRMFSGKLIFRFIPPSRGDVVVFKQTVVDITKPDAYWIKRIVAVGGDTIEIRNNNRVYINGKILEELYLLGNYGKSNKPMEPLHVPESKYFVIGDNRDNSYDSRNMADPFIPMRNIEGKLLIRFWPPNRIGVIR